MQVQACSLCYISLVKTDFIRGEEAWTQCLIHQLKIIYSSRWSSDWLVEEVMPCMPIYVCSVNCACFKSKVIKLYVYCKFYLWTLWLVSYIFCWHLTYCWLLSETCQAAFVFFFFSLAVKLDWCTLRVSGHPAFACYRKFGACRRLCTLVPHQWVLMLDRSCTLCLTEWMVWT